VREANQLLGGASELRFQGWMCPAYARVVVLADKDDEKQGRRDRAADAAPSRATGWSPRRPAKSQVKTPDTAIWKAKCASSPCAGSKR
jgi:hypothetical protein